MMQTLILVDLQNDFCPGGALGVPEGDTVIPLANKMAKTAQMVIATQDWHPPGHASFASQHPGHNPGDVISWKGQQQVLWPDHCVQHTTGAEFHPQLDVAEIDHVFRKGENQHIDSYSGFFDNDHQHATGLGDFLNRKGVREITICGLATDYCVKFTVLDALQLNFKTYVIADACRGVNRNPDDSDKALQEMQNAGAQIISMSDAVA